MITFEPAIARCHQRCLPVVDAVGRPLTEGDRVRSGRGLPDALPEPGKVIFLFNFADTHAPDLEVQLGDGRIVCHYSRLTGGCWKFDTVTLEVV